MAEYLITTKHAMTDWTHKFKSFKDFKEFITNLDLADGWDSKWSQRVVQDKVTHTLKKVSK